MEKINKTQAVNVWERVTSGREQMPNTEELVMESWDNALRLLQLPEEVLEMLRSGKLTAGHARAVLSIGSEKKQREAAQKIAALGLSVRQAELLCKNMNKAPVPEKLPTLAVDYIGECEKQLSKHLGRGVKIVSGKRKGRFELEYYGAEDLQNLLDALMKLK